MKVSLPLFLFFIFSIPVKSQSTCDSVIAAVNNLFTAMKEADTVLLKSCFSPNAVLQTIKEINGTTKVVDEEIADFIKAIGKEIVGAADERIELETVKIDGPLAVAWTPYKFYYKGKFSHCGVNAFQLVRLKNGWKIQYIIDTRRKDGCQL